MPDSPQAPAAAPTSENIGKYIRGELGPAPMTGVMTFPYTVSQRLYHQDFSAIAAATIQHPFMATAKPIGSTPHNLLTGSAFSDSSAFTSEAQHEYGYKSYTLTRQMQASGVRVEQQQA